MIVLEIVGVWFLAGLALSVVIVAQLPAQLRPTDPSGVVPAHADVLRALDQARRGPRGFELGHLPPSFGIAQQALDREAQAKALRLRLYVVCSECARLIDLAKVIGNSETLRE